MDGQKRRSMILKELKKSEKAIPARKFSEKFKVSRQVIVGDIALLRAEGEEIISSYKGYHLKNKEKGYVGQYVAIHHEKETQKELETLLELGASILDVRVEHPVYGEIIGRLDIENKEDIQSFMQEEPQLLSSLTDGIHIHSIVCKSEEHFNEVLTELDKLGFLYKD